MIFDPLTAGSLLILAAAPNSELCKMPKPTEIEVVPHAESVEFDYSQSLADLESVETDTIDPHNFGGLSVSEGFMESSIRLEPEVELDGKVYTGLNMACLWYDRITISLKIAPVITIASEVADDDCMFEAVKNHEMKHVRALRKLVNKYSDSMGREVYQQLEQRGFNSGPVPEEHSQQIAERMQKTVAQILELQFKKLEIENAEEQGKVDSIEEYKYVSSLCPDFKLGKTLSESRGDREEDD